MDDKENIEAYYGLPSEVRFCKKCVISNQRPNSTLEFRQNIETKKVTIFFDEEGVCSACRHAEKKENEIDWKKREEELRALCDRFRRDDGNYDCIVPGSGGKDSVFVSHMLKDDYDMHPLTVTWTPHIYTDVGWRNLVRWVHSGFDNILFQPNGKVHRLLTKLAFTNMLHPFQPFIYGQKNIGPKFAALYNIPLVFYGESGAEYGNPIAETHTSLGDPKYFIGSDYEEMNLGGMKVKDIMETYNLKLVDLMIYLPMDKKLFENKNIEVHYCSYYKNWDPQEHYYYAVEHTGFESNTERTEGTYSKYSSIDDKSDPFHYYTTLIKFGIGRTSYDAAQEIRNHKITREEGIALVKKYDQEFPKKYFKEFLEYIDMTEAQFWETIDKFRSPHLWKKEKKEWKLRHAIWNEEYQK